MPHFPALGASYVIFFEFSLVCSVVYIYCDWPVVITFVMISLLYSGSQSQKINYQHEQLLTISVVLWVIQNNFSVVTTNWYVKIKFSGTWLGFVTGFYEPKFTQAFQHLYGMQYH